MEEVYEKVESANNLTRNDLSKFKSKVGSLEFQQKEILEGKEKDISKLQAELTFLQEEKNLYLEEKEGEFFVANFWCEIDLLGNLCIGLHAWLAKVD